MSILICPDCGGKVSEHATACPHCGCPIKVVAAQTTPKEKNRIAELNLSDEAILSLTTLLKNDDSTKPLALCELINIYFEYVKRGYRASTRFGMSVELGKGLENLLIITKADDEKVEDAIDQTALYRNLYPGSFSKIKNDILEYFTELNLTQAFEWLEQYAKEQDGPYEEMLRRKGVTDPF